MPDAFFASQKTRKRKRTESSSAQRPRRPQKVNPKDPKQSAQPKSRKRDEELSDHTDNDDGNIDDMDLRADDVDSAESGDEDDNETPAEKRLRLAQMYLETVKTDLADGEFDAAEIDKELISARLKKDVLDHAGKVHLFIADSFDFSHPPKCLRTRGHRFSVTSAVVSESARVLFTSGKEGSIIKWDLRSGKKLATIYKVRPPTSDKKGKSKATDQTELNGHTDEVLSLALSGDGKLLVSSSKDKRICVWDQESTQWVKTFAGHLGHRDVISSVVFRKGTNHLYSSSFDRSVKVYDLSPSVMGYVETLFGHQDHIYHLDALRGETCVSVGSRDRTARYWKIADETQLVFRGGGRSRLREVLEGGLKGDGDDDEDPQKQKQNTLKFVEGSLECVAMIDETTFVTGGDSGTISLWNATKKKPIFSQHLAHGIEETPSESEGVVRKARWVTSVASLRYSDLFASGSYDGEVRLWKLDAKMRSFSLVGSIPVNGVINSLQMTVLPSNFFEEASWASDGETESGRRRVSGHPFLLVAGVGQEPRLGRWMTLKDGVANSAVCFAFSPRTL